MHLSRSSTAILLAFAAAVTAQSTTCDGLTEPDWDDCRTLFSAYAMSSGSFPAPGEGKCYIMLDPNESALNCRATLCPYQNIPITASRVSLAFTILEATCDPNNAAGTQIVDETDGFNLTVEYNPEYAEPAPGALESTRRRHAREVFRRQQDSDTSFELDATYTSITRPGYKWDIGVPIPGGSSMTHEVTEEMSMSVTTGVSFSAGIEEIFSAGASVEYTNEYSISNTVGTMIVVNCASNGQGQIQWEPFWDRYDGSFRPSGDFVTVWIPTDSGQYSFRCLG